MTTETRYAEPGVYAPNTPAAIAGMTVFEAAESFDCWWPECLPVAPDDEMDLSKHAAHLVVRGEGRVGSLDVDARCFDVERVAEGILANPDVTEVEVYPAGPAATLRRDGLVQCPECTTVIHADRPCGFCADQAR